MPRKAELAEINQVFLSATAKDCITYRQSVRDFLQNNIPAIKIFLQEDWAEGGRSVVNACKQKLDSSDAYLGLFGFRYGWIPPEHTKSITELEFAWAVTRWPQREPPIFILLPEKNSAAEQQLTTWMQEIIETEFQDATAQQIDFSAQQVFLSGVIKWAAADGRMLVYYRDHIQLLGKALSCIQNWNRDLLHKALQGRRSVQGDIPADELGRIGRETQRQALENALETFHNRARERAIALLVHGPENFGQREFSHFLKQWEDWETSRVFCGQAAEPESIDALICWACGQLQEPIVGPPTIEALAAVLLANLARDSVVFIVRSLGRRDDRLTIFLETFWQPLLTLLALHPVGLKGRLYWLVIEHVSLPHDGVPGVFCTEPAADNLDYQQLVSLPPLAEIKPVDVKRWLKDAGVSLEQEALQCVCERVTHADGIPANVYNRLALEGFWA